MKHTFNYKTAFRILKGGKVSMVVSAFLAGATMSFANPVNNALPTNGNVVSGNVNISTNVNTMNINQASNKSIINWNTYNIGKDSTVNYNFAQTNSSSLNRVTSNDPSEIYGNLNANGKVILVNPNGVIFGKGSSVNVGSLVATTMNIKDSDYLNDKEIYSRDNAVGSIVNEGIITAQEKGYIALLSPKVLNDGVIRAVKGTISLSGADKIELTLDNSGLKTVIVEPSTIQTLIENKSLVEADGGIIYIGVKQAEQLLDTAMNIKNSGTLQANSMDDLLGKITVEAKNIENSGNIHAKGGGEILIGGDWQGVNEDKISHAQKVTLTKTSNIDVSATNNNGNGGKVVVWSSLANNGETTVDGTIRAEGGKDSGNGGKIETSGGVISIQKTTNISTKAHNGTTGTWLLDPKDIVIQENSQADSVISGIFLNTAQSNANSKYSTSYITKSTVESALASNNFEIRTFIDNGILNANLAVESANGDILVNTPLSWNSANTLTLNADRSIFINQNITAPSGKLSLIYGQRTPTLTYNQMAYDQPEYYLAKGVSINLGLGDNFITKYAGGNAMTYSVIDSLESIRADLTKNYALQSTINLNNATFAPIGGNSTLDYFSGHFTGLGHEIKNINIGNGTTDMVGLFGRMYNTSTYQYAKGIRDVFLNGGTAKGFNNVGSFVGSGNNMSLLNVSSNLAVEGSSRVGGLVGDGNSLSIIRSNNIGNINSTGTGFYFGGLAGNLSSSSKIFESFSDVTINGAGNYVGGLVGGLNDDSVIVNSYSIGGALNGTNNIGGLVGGIYKSSITTTIPSSYLAIVTSYSDHTLTPTATTNLAVGGLVGSIGYSGTSNITNIPVLYNSFYYVNNVGELSTINPAGTVDSHFTGTAYYYGSTGGAYYLSTSPFIRGNMTAQMLNYYINSGNPLNTTTNTIKYSANPYTSNNGPAGGSASSLYWNIVYDDNLDYGVIKLADVSQYGGMTYDYTNLQAVEITLPSQVFNLYNSNTSSKVWVIGNKNPPLTYNLSNINSGYTYNGTIQLPTQWTSSSIFGNTYNSWVAGTDYNFIYNNQIINGFTDAGTYSNISIDILKAGFTEATTGNTLGTFTISPFALTVSNFSASNKIYDGLTTATVSGTLNKFGSDDVTLTGLFDDKNAGTNKTVTAGLTGTKASNYTLSNTPITTIADISKLVLTNINGFIASNKIYDGIKTAIVDSSNVVYDGKLSGDVLSIASSTNEFDTKNVGTAKTVSISNIILDGADKDNYALPLNFTTTTLANITQKALTITALDVSKVYDGGLTYSVTQSDLNSLSSQLGINTDNISSITLAYTDKNVGTDNKTVTASNAIINDGNNGANYNITYANNSTSSITPKALTLSGATVLNRVYDGTLIATISSYGTLNGVVGNEDVTINLSSATASFVDKNAGTNKTVNISGATLDGNDTSNYSANSSITAIANITKADITDISGITASNKTYDGTTNAILNTSNASFLGKVGNDNLAIATSNGTFDNKNAGTGKSVNITGLSLSGNDANNYNLTNTTSTTTADITKKDITNLILKREYDGTTTILDNVTLESSDFIDGENLKISGQGTIALKNASTNTQNIILGTIVLANGEDGTLASNYNLATTPQALISKKALTLSDLAVENKIYDDTRNASITNFGTLRGLISGDDVNINSINKSALFDTKEIGDDKVVAISGITLGGADVDNYETTFSLGTTANITKIPLKYSIKDMKLISGGKLELPQAEFESTQFSFNPQYEIKVVDKNGNEVEDINKLPVGKYKIKVINFDDAKYVLSNLSKDGELVVNPASNPDAIVENSIKINNIEKTKLDEVQLKEKIVSSNDKKLNIDETPLKVSLDKETLSISNDKTQLVSEVSFESNPFVSNSLITIENGGVKDVKTQKEEAKTKDSTNNVILTSNDLDKNSIVAKVNFDKNNNFSFTMKEAVNIKMKVEDIKDVKATLSSGESLPNWLKFDKSTQTFLAINPPIGSLPIATKVIFKDLNKEEIIAVEITK